MGGLLNCNDILKLWKLGIFLCTSSQTERRELELLNQTQTRCRFSRSDTAFPPSILLCGYQLLRDLKAE
jgi:hypothetical protein